MSKTLHCAVDCPKCKYYKDYYQAPQGKIIRNPYAIANGVVYDDCNACNGTGFIPHVILDAITNFASTDEKAKQYIADLRWSMDHFSFQCGGMYVGIELDGYMHS
jgi:hypothetical protein